MAKNRLEPIVADTPPLDNEAARKALELLIEAVAKEIKPGVLELKLAASTLRDLLEEPTPQAFSLALRAFNAIDPATRGRIQEHAKQAATTYRTRQGASVTVPSARPEKPKSGGGLLGALNFGLSFQNKPGSKTSK